MSDSNAQKPKDDLPKPKPPATKKDNKKSLKGVVVKKRAKAPEKSQEKGKEGSKTGSLAAAKDSPKKEDDGKRPAKKQKLG